MQCVVCAADSFRYRPPPQQHTAAAWQQPSPGAAAPTVDVKPSSQYGYNNVSYKAVPPPASLVNPQSQRSGVGHQPQRQPPGVIRPNSNRPWIKPQISRQINHSPSFPAVDSNKCSSMVSVALASAASISSGRPVGQKPAYIRVGEPPSAVVPGVSASKSKHPALNPQNWPPAVKSYVERAFKTTPASQRPKLREALRSIIGEAQEKGATNRGCVFFFYNLPPKIGGPSCEDCHLSGKRIFDSSLGCSIIYLQVSCGHEDGIPFQLQICLCLR